MDFYHHIILDARLLEGVIDSANYIVKGNQVTISIFAQRYGCCDYFNYYNPVFTRTYIVCNLTSNNLTLTYSNANGSLSDETTTKTEIINLKR